MQKVIFLREGFSMDNVFMRISSIMMVIIMKGKCTRINSMAWVLLPTVKLSKKDFSDMVNLCLESLISMMELFIKVLCKMDKNQVKEPFKEKMDFTTLDILNTISSMGMDKFITQTNQHTKDILKKASNMEKAVS